MIVPNRFRLLHRLDPLVIGLALTAGVFFIARGWQREPWIYIAAFLMWTVALGIVLLRWTTPRRAGQGLARLIADRELVTHCLLLFLIALVVRAVALDRVPANLGGDEFSQALEAKAFAEGGLRNMFGTSDWYGIAQMYPWLGSFFFRLFGYEPWVWRLFTALAGSVTVPLLYLLVRVQFDSIPLALAAGGLLVFNHIHVFFSRLGSNQGFDALFTTALLLALILARRDPDRGLWWYVAGVIGGLGFYFYFALRGIAAIALLIIVIWALRREAPRLRAPLWYAIGLILAAAPLLGRPPGGQAINTRLFQVLEVPGRGDTALVKDLLARSVIGLRSLQGLTLRGWYQSGAGIVLTQLEVVLLALGVVIALRRVRNEGWIHPFLLAGVLAMVALFTEAPVMSQRVSSLSVPVAVLVALGADHVARLLIPRHRADVTLALVALMGGLNLYHVFLHHMPQRTTDTTALVATELARRLSKEPEIRELVFCGGGRMFWNSNSSLRFQLPELLGRDVDDNWQVSRDPAAPHVAYVALEGCSDMRYELELQSTLVGEELRYRTSSDNEALRMYRDTGGLGYIRWVSIDDVVPFDDEEELIMSVFTARPKANG